MWRAASAAAGLFGVLAGGLAFVDRAGMVHYLVSGVVLCLGGTLLLWSAGTGRTIGPASAAATVPVCLIGLALSLLVVRETVCCMFGYSRGRGFPWNMLHWHGSADTLEEIQRLRSDPRLLDFSVDPFRIVMDSVFWWYAAVLAVLPGQATLRVCRRRRAGG